MKEILLNTCQKSDNLYAARVFMHICGSGIWELELMELEIVDNFYLQSG